MSTSVRRILTDKGTLYVAFENVLNQFVTPPCRSVDEFVEYMSTHKVNRWIAREQWQLYATEAKLVYDVRRETIHNAVRYLAELKSGRSLTDEQACELYAFEKFLQATVAVHQYDYPQFNARVLEKWIGELGLRKLYPNDFDCWDIESACRGDVYYNAWGNKNTPRVMGDAKSGKATPEQNKFIGRCLSAQCKIANIAGTGKSTPAEIVERFFRKFQREEKRSK